jgi:hypothetical protein
MNTNSNHHAVRRQHHLTRELIEALAADDTPWAQMIARVLRHEYRDWNPPPLAKGWRLGE